MATNSNDIMSKSISVPSILSVYTDEQLNREYHSKAEYQSAIDNYGVIFKVVSFSELSSEDDLRNACNDWIRRNYFDGVLSFTVKLIDLHLLGYDKDQIMVGDQIRVHFLDGVRTPTTKVLTVLSVQYDILKPENTTVKIGIPDVSANLKYRKSVNKKSSSGTKPTNPDGDGDGDAESFWKKINDSTVASIIEKSLGLGYGDPSSLGENDTDNYFAGN